MTVELLPHQVKALAQMRNGTVLTGGVGTGKTVTALAYFIEKECGGKLNEYGGFTDKKDLYVFTTARKRDELDWQKWAMRLGISTDRECSATGIQLTVDSYNNITKYKEVKDAFIILDEQRMVGSGTWSKSFIEMARSNRWIMLSATPGDVWEDYIPLFIANGFYKDRSQFKREHCVYSYYGRYPKLERYLNVNKLVKLKNSILVEMPYDRHTTRHVLTVPVDYDKSLFERVVKKRWHVYEERPLKDVSELFSVMRKVVNSDGSRIETVQSLLEDHPRLIVFYSFDYELEILRSLINNHHSSSKTEAGKNLANEKEPGSTDGRGNSQRDTKKASSSSLNGLEGSPTHGENTIQIAEWNGHKHEPVPTSDRWVYLVQYVAGAEAWNCVETNAVAFYSLTYSYKNFMQAQGRIDRLNTPYFDLYYYVLVSDSPFDKAVSKSLKNKKDFNEKDFMRSG